MLVKKRNVLHTQGRQEKCITSASLSTRLRSLVGTIADEKLNSTWRTQTLDSPLSGHPQRRQHHLSESDHQGRESGTMTLFLYKPTRTSQAQCTQRSVRRRHTQHLGPAGSYRSCGETLLTSNKHSVGYNMVCTCAQDTLIEPVNRRCTTSRSSRSVLCRGAWGNRYINLRGLKRLRKRKNLNCP